MRLFQNASVYPTYLAQLRGRMRREAAFAGRIKVFLEDRYGAVHHLKPVLDFDPDAFFTNGDDEETQRLWAKGKGMADGASLEDILLAQIEEHRAEIFYNSDPIRFGASLLRRLPGSVRKSIAWRAAPSGSADFSAYDLIVCNFPSILKSYDDAGWRSAWFAPAHDPEMDAYAANTDRPIDILFMGGYSRHHTRRAEVLTKVAGMAGARNVMFCLDRSRMTRLAESPLGLIGPLQRHRRPAAIRKVSHEPVFGRALYDLASRAKIVLNGAVDMAGSDRGNMRCWEAMGCGALLLSDTGNYPPGMNAAETIAAYDSPAEAVSLAAALLDDPQRRLAIANLGFQTMRQAYSKAGQWAAFCELAN